jgi:hypothetical protein
VIVTPANARPVVVDVVEGAALAGGAPEETGALEGDKSAESEAQAAVVPPSARTSAIIA